MKSGPLPEAMRLPEIPYLPTTVDGACVVTTPAEIDIVTAEQLRAALLQAPTAKPPVVVVDMTGTLFCDSSGLHALLRAHRRFGAEGGGLRLVIPPDGVVARILNLTGLRTVIPCFRSLADAVAGTRALADPVGG